MKNKWSNYALKDGKIKESYIREYSNRSPKREARETSSRNSLQQSWKKQEEIEMIIRPELPLCLKEIIDKEIEWYGKVLEIKEQVVYIGDENHESSREENPSETHQEGRQGVSCPDKGRCETEKTNPKIQNGEKKVKEKVTAKERKHEAKESKAFEKKEDNREAKKESKGKKK